MKYLLIDTSSTIAQIALANENKIIVQKTWNSYRNLSEKLLVNIENLLLRKNIKPSELDGVMVYLGPGTFTGLRIGIAIANAFSYALDIPIFGLKGGGFGKKKFEIKELKPIDLAKMLRRGLKEIKNRGKSRFVVPFYGKKPNVK